jgi:hypothetical protein
MSTRYYFYSYSAQQQCMFLNLDRTGLCGRRVALSGSFARGYDVSMISRVHKGYSQDPPLPVDGPFHTSTPPASAVDDLTCPTSHISYSPHVSSQEIQ